MSGCRLVCHQFNAHATAYVYKKNKLSKRILADLVPLLESNAGVQTASPTGLSQTLLDTKTRSLQRLIKHTFRLTIDFSYDGVVGTIDACKFLQSLRNLRELSLKKLNLDRALAWVELIAHLTVINGKQMMTELPDGVLHNHNYGLILPQTIEQLTNLHLRRLSLTHLQHPSNEPRYLANENSMMKLLASHPEVEEIVVGSSSPASYMLTSPDTRRINLPRKIHLTRLQTVFIDGYMPLCQPGTLPLLYPGKTLTSLTIINTPLIPFFKSEEARYLPNLRSFTTDADLGPVPPQRVYSDQVVIDELMTGFLASLTRLEEVAVRVSHLNIILRALIPSKKTLAKLTLTKIDANTRLSALFLRTSDIELLANYFPRITDLTIDWRQIDITASFCPWFRALGSCRNLRRLTFKRSFGSKADDMKSLTPSSSRVFVERYKGDVVRFLINAKEGMPLERCDYMRESGELISIKQSWVCSEYQELKWSLGLAYGLV